MKTLALPAVRDRDLRLGALALFGTAAVWNALPVHPPLVCPLRSATGVPCPMCGMTRACAAAAQGDLGSSLAYNPAGVLVLLFVGALFVRPQWLAYVRVRVWWLGVALGLLWLWNVGVNPTFRQWLL